MANHLYSVGRIVDLYSEPSARAQALIFDRHTGEYGGPEYKVYMVLDNGELSAREFSIKESNILGLAATGSDHYELAKVQIPFEGKRWVISREGDSPFGTYRTKKEARVDARAYGLKLTDVGEK